jgi:hypothetical protein
MAVDVHAAYLKIRDADLAEQDAEDPVTEAMADRDAADVALDLLPREASRLLGSRSDDAKRKPPWTLIFPDGVMYYTVSPVSQEVGRYTLLADRLEQYLPAEDPVRAVASRVREALVAWTRAEEAIQRASVVLEAAAVARDKAEADWRSFMDRLYGALRADLGRDEAESFFRRSARKRGKGRPETQAEDQEG